LAKKLVLLGSEAAFFIAYMTVISSGQKDELVLILSAIAVMGICTTIMWIFCFERFQGLAA